MKKRLCALLSAFLMLGLLALPALALENKPDWYPEDVNAFQDFHNDPSTPRLVDNADIFTDEDEAELTAKLNSLRSSNPDSDFVVFTDTSSYGLNHDVYAADFYVFNGYGVGSDFNGVILFICMEQGNRGWQTWGTGKCEKLFRNDDNIDHLNNTISPYLVRGDYAKGVSAYLDDMEVLFRKGKFPRSAASSLLILIGALFGGLIIAIVVRSVLMSEMNTVHEAVQADRYLVQNSVQLRHSADYFLYRTVHRVKREKKRGSSHSTRSSSGRRGSGGGGRF